MMKLLQTKIIILFLLLSAFGLPPIDNTVQANESLPDSSSNLKFSVGLSGFPKYAYRVSRFHLNETDADYVVNKYLYDELKKLENGKYVLDFGIIVGYQLKKNIQIQSGLFYINNGEKQDYFEIYNFDTTIYKLFNSYNYIGLPISCKYRLFGKKWNLNAVAGLSVNYFLFKKGVFKPHLDDYIVTNNTLIVKRINKTDFASVPDWNFELILGLCAEYKLNNKVSVGIEPVYRRELLPIEFKENGIKEYHYSYGVEILLITKI